MDDDTRLRGRTGSSPVDDDEVWFEPKRYGYGAGLPITREGWILLGSYVGTMLVMLATLRRLGEMNPLYMLAPVTVMVAATIWFVPLCSRHTRGGWHWRWGGDED